MLGRHAWTSCVDDCHGTVRVLELFSIFLFWFQLICCSASYKNPRSPTTDGCSQTHSLTGNKIV